MRDPFLVALAMEHERPEGGMPMYLWLALPGGIISGQLVSTSRFGEEVAESVVASSIDPVTGDEVVDYAFSETLAEGDRDLDVGEIFETGELRNSGDGPDESPKGTISQDGYFVHLIDVHLLAPAGQGPSGAALLLGLAKVKISDVSAWMFYKPEDPSPGFA